MGQGTQQDDEMHKPHSAESLLTPIAFHRLLQGFSSWLLEDSGSGQPQNLILNSLQLRTDFLFLKAIHVVF